MLQAGGGRAIKNSAIGGTAIEAKKRQGSVLEIAYAFGRRLLRAGCVNEMLT